MRASAVAVVLSVLLLPAALHGAAGYYTTPDIHGDLIVFAAEGDLWLSPGHRGPSLRLTTHPGPEYFPSFSPDGARIAFTGEHDRNADGYVTGLEPGTYSVQFTDPDGVLAGKQLVEPNVGGDDTVDSDAIGDTTLAFQAKLLRILEDRAFYPVGAEIPRLTEARMVAATHRHLEERVQEGTFREDLFYRLNVVPIHIPPLRERREDIPALAHAFVIRHAEGENRSISSEALELLTAADWPGNGRELENAIERAVVDQTQRPRDRRTGPLPCRRSG